jgi:hypothetical protein
MFADGGLAEKRFLSLRPVCKKMRDGSGAGAVCRELAASLPARARSSPRLEAAGYLFRRHVLDVSCDLPRIALWVLDHGAPIAIVHVCGRLE